MKATVRWLNELNFVGENDKGQQVMYGGDGDFPSPMENVLMAAGSCSAIDVVSILKKARQPIDGCVCELEAVRRDEAPRIFTQIKAHYRVSGEKLKQTQVERAVELSVEKYCSVLLMLMPGVAVQHSYAIEVASDLTKKKDAQ